MRHWCFFIAAILLAAFVSSPVGAEEHKYLKAFPAAAEGMVRYVINLPEKERGVDSGFQVELIVGKQMLTDGVNRVRLSGEIQAKPLKGWGFTYYEVPKFGPAATTLIGVRPGTPQVKKFVTIPSKQIAYNSRVPVVVYVPKGAEVQYRIWKAGPAQKAEATVVELQ